MNSRFTDPEMVATAVVERVNGDRQGTLRAGNERYGGSVCVEADNGHDAPCWVWLTREEIVTFARNLLAEYGEEAK